ncbi:hypothetical protein FGB62_325g015 [Gracilaria domingensis]|nr:hypothetical protein FGB62_325g015 [Gracilaria domingensis]
MQRSSGYADARAPRSHSPECGETPEHMMIPLVLCDRLRASSGRDELYPFAAKHALLVRRSKASSAALYDTVAEH